MKTIQSMDNKLKKQKLYFDIGSRRKSIFGELEEAFFRFWERVNALISERRTVDDIPLQNRILPITGILVFLVLVYFIFDVVRKKCCAWKNSFGSNAVLFDDEGPVVSLYSDGQTEVRLFLIYFTKLRKLNTWSYLSKNFKNYVKMSKAIWIFCKNWAEIRKRES